MKPIELHLGQPVPLERSPSKQAQILELHLSNVTLGYRRNGHLIRIRMNAERVHRLIEQEPPLIAHENPLGLGVVRKSKTFTPGRRYGFRPRRTHG